MRIHGFTGPVILELFSPASREFLQQMAAALPNFTLEVSLESHDPGGAPRLRQALRQ